MTHLMPHEAIENHHQADPLQSNQYMLNIGLFAKHCALQWYMPRGGKPRSQEGYTLFYLDCTEVDEADICKFCSIHNSYSFILQRS